MRRTPGAIRRAEPFRHDPLTTELARLAVNNRAVLLEVFIEHDAQMRAAEQFREQCFSVLDWLAAQVPTALASASWRRINSNTASPFSSQTIASPSIRHERTGSSPTAIAIKGKRDEKSFPARVISCTPAGPRRAKIRKPSCLISCSQPEPEGGTFAGDGRHGSIIPKPGRVRSRNDIVGF